MTPIERKPYGINGFSKGRRLHCETTKELGESHKIDENG